MNQEEGGSSFPECEPESSASSNTALAPAMPSLGGAGRDLGTSIRVIAFDTRRKISTGPDAKTHEVARLARRTIEDREVDEVREVSG